MKSNVFISILATAMLVGQIANAQVQGAVRSGTGAATKSATGAVGSATAGTAAAAAAAQAAAAEISRIMEGSKVMEGAVTGFITELQRSGLDNETVRILGDALRVGLIQAKGCTKNLGLGSSNNEALVNLAKIVSQQAQIMINEKLSLDGLVRAIKSSAVRAEDKQTLAAKLRSIRAGVRTSFASVLASSKALALSTEEVNTRITQLQGESCEVLSPAI